jgi:hypothetical protein
MEIIVDGVKSFANKKWNKIALYQCLISYLADFI